MSHSFCYEVYSKITFSLNGQRQWSFEAFFRLAQLDQVVPLRFCAFCSTRSGEGLQGC